METSSVVSQEAVQREKNAAFLRRAADILGDAATGDVPGILPYVWSYPDARTWRNVATLRSYAAFVHDDKPYVVQTGINLQSVDYFCGGYIAFGGRLCVYSPVQNYYHSNTWSFYHMTEEQWLRLPRVEAYLGEHWLSISAEERPAVPRLRQGYPQWGLAKSVARQIISHSAGMYKGIVSFWDRTTLQDPGHLNLIGLAATTMAGKQFGWNEGIAFQAGVTFPTNVQHHANAGDPWEGYVTVQNVDKGPDIRNPNSGNQVRQFTIYLSSGSQGRTTAMQHFPRLSEYAARSNATALPTGQRLEYPYGGVAAPHLGMGFNID